MVVSLQDVRKRRPSTIAEQAMMKGTYGNRLLNGSFTYTETGMGTDPCSGGYPYGYSCTMQKVHTGPKQGQTPVPNWLLCPFLGQGPIPGRGLCVCERAIRDRAPSPGEVSVYVNEP